MNPVNDFRRATTEGPLLVLLMEGEAEYEGKTYTLNVFNDTFEPERLLSAVVDQLNRSFVNSKNAVWRMKKKSIRILYKGRIL